MFHWFFGRETPAIQSIQLCKELQWELPTRCWRENSLNQAEVLSNPWHYWQRVRLKIAAVYKLFEDSIQLFELSRASHRMQCNVLLPLQALVQTVDFIGHTLIYAFTQQNKKFPGIIYWEWRLVKHSQYSDLLQVRWSRFKSQWGRDFLYPFRLAPRSSQSPVW